MRNIFDQYSQPENRLTHALMTVLDKDRDILRSFLDHFSIVLPCGEKKLSVSEQTVPGIVAAADEREAERRGLPDGLIYNADQGCALIVESKINLVLTEDQLRRHWSTIRRCGYDDVRGLAITVEHPPFQVAGWRFVTWREIYSWGCGIRNTFSWAAELIDYFNMAEARMAQQEYLLEGTITEFSGIDLDRYTYLEGKRALRLLTGKLKDNKSFVKKMKIDRDSGRASITNDLWGVWDYIAFQSSDDAEESFRNCPHITVGFSARDKSVDAMVTFPNGMSGRLVKNLIGESCEDFLEKLNRVYLELEESLRGARGFQPVIRVMQRHYKSLRSAPTVDGVMTVDLRACFGGLDPNTGQAIKKQKEWAEAAYALLANKRSNLQMQVGVIFAAAHCAELKSRNADDLFYRSFLPLRSFVDEIIG